MASYSSIDNSDAKFICEKYGVKLESIVPMKGGAANSSFILNKIYILTILDNHDQDSALTLTLVMDHLSESGIPTQKLMKTVEGEMLVTHNDNIVIVREMIFGKTFDKQENKNYRAVGKLLAKIHSCVCPEFEFQCDRKIPKDWEKVFTDSIVSGSSELQKNLRYSVSEETNIFASNLPSGFIHGDLFEDNIVQKSDSELFAIDWETASEGPFVYDIGISLVAMAKSSDDHLNLEIMNELIAGYEEIRALTEEEKSVLFIATGYAASMLSFHRYFRHVVRYPNPEKFDFFEELMRFSNNVYTL